MLCYILLTKVVPYQPKLLNLLLYICKLGIEKPTEFLLTILTNTMQRTEANNIHSEVKTIACF